MSNTAVIEEYNQWNIHKLSNIKLVSAVDNSLIFRFGVQEWTVIIPNNYPSKELIMVDYDTVHEGYKFVNSLNKYIVKRNVVELITLLNHIDKKCSKINTELFTTEAKYRELLETTCNNNVTDKDVTDMKCPKLFTNDVTSSILINEHMKLRSRYHVKKDIFIKTVDNDIFNWSITFRNLGDKDELLKSVGEDSVVISIKFHRSLYPCYPPYIKVDSPFVDDNFVNSVSKMKMVNTDYWTPCRTTEFIIDKLRNTLIKHLVIKTDIIKTPLCVKLESALVKLSSLINTDSIDELDDEQYIKNVFSTTTASSWASGTGYSSSNSKGWNIDEYIKVQHEKDVQIQKSLYDIIDAYRNLSDDEKVVAVELVKIHKVTEIIQSYLRGTTLLEMEKKSTVYTNIFSLINMLATEDAVFLLYTSTGNSNIVESLNSLSKDIKTVIKISPESNSDLCKTVTGLCEKISSLSYCSTHMTEQHVKTHSTQHELYVETLEDYRFSSDDINDFSFEASTYIQSSTVKRLASEYVSLQSGLPVHYESSIYVVSDENNTRCMRALITGPEDTPYESGVFIFDIYITDEYPKTPPKMVLVNTGDIRFNPNLYKNGKVCLSLLGTWRGSAGEEWNKDTSTLQQLLISVQSQILTDAPVFNEPGHEKSIGTSIGDTKNKHYNQYIRYYTMLHAVKNIVGKYPEFEDIIKHHFSIKKDSILNTYRRWVEESYHVSASLQHRGELNKDMYHKLYSEVETVLNSL